MKFIEALRLKNMDSLYFGSLISVVELNNRLSTTVYKASRLEISPSETVSNIENSIFKIKRKWKSYESHYKRDDELQYVDYTAADDALNNEVLITRADEMLYKAKDGGRDRYFITSNVSEARVQEVENLTAS